MIAHRGASADAAEHTVAAYDLALAQGADVLEIDVRTTADGELVLVHDPTLARTAGDPRRVDALTLAEVRAADPTVLTLEAFLTRYRRRARLLVDLKEPAPAWEPQLLAALDRHGVAERCTVQAFDHDALRRLRERAPRLRLGALLATPAGLAPLAAFAQQVAIAHPLLDPAFVAEARARGLRALAWTADDLAELARLAAAGADGLITNVPAVALAVAAGAETPLAA